MIAYLTLILCCQLAGELITVASGIPIPGPVVGMVILFAGLLARGRLPDGLAAVADTLLRHLSLLFVPAGVGVVLHLNVVSEDWPAIAVALVVSTLATIAVTAWVMVLLGRHAESDTGADER